MSWFNDTPIGVPRPTWRRLVMLVEEVSHIEYDEELGTDDIRKLAERLAVSVIDEYVKQHFRESTQEAAKRLVSRHKQRTMLESL